MIHFILTPDKAVSIALKRLVAQQGARINVVVGTFPELLTVAKNCHVLPAIIDEWQVNLSTALKELQDAFWSDSLHNVESEAENIASVIGQILTTLLEASGPFGRFDEFDLTGLSLRTQKRFNDLTALHNSMANALPRDLALIKQVLTARDDRKLRSIRVYYIKDWPKLNPWQLALIESLNSNATFAEDVSLVDLLADLLAKPLASPQTALHHLQSNLFSTTSQKTTLDNTVQWLAARDYLQEVEITAGMIQKALKDDQSLTFRDIAILLPNDERYFSAAESVFRHAGIPLSVLGGDSAVRDLGGEMVSNLLLTLHKPAPLIALASLLVSPLMPWDIAEGNRLAHKVMNGHFDLSSENNDDAASKILRIICDGVNSVETLRIQLQRFVKLLGRDEILHNHRDRAQAICNDLINLLNGKTGEIPWADLQKFINIQPQTVASDYNLFREGLAVFREGEEPWRTVQRLFVLGCSEGHYPPQATLSKVFTDTELLSIQAATGLNLETSNDRNWQQRQLFRRQLCSASDEITFLLPRRDPLGKPLSPSASLTFASSLFSNISDEESLTLELDREADLDKVRGLPVGIEITAEDTPAQPEIMELNFGCNLLELNKRVDGTLKPESPSRLEKLMVSPLAWLFERLGVEPREWHPETLDIMSKGTLAHHVFEHLFKRGVPIPASQFIEQNVPLLLEEGIHAMMPFLKRDEWKVEREHLKKDILKAALRWGEILKEIGAEVIATEIPLAGMLGDIPIHGNADLLLELPGKRLFVVDYKKSSSGGRRTRMKQGYDHQAELYRTMIKTGGLKNADKADDSLADTLAYYKDAGEIGTLYYLMNDQTALADTSGWIFKTTGEEIDSNTSVAAMKLINDRIAQLKSGKVDLQLFESEKALKDKRGLGTYALDSSPLVRMFVKEPAS